MIMAADLFCGAGGSSTGLIQATRELGLELNLLAINHWQVAVESHERNHPWARHMCADLGSVDPSKAVPGKRLDLLIASPECTHHSNARGGKPCDDQSRASAWHVLHWAERLRVDRILVENVREFESWGPLNRYGRPIKRRRGETFKAFVNALRSLGYEVDHRVLNAADYGDATCRRRLFIQASRREPITWPDPSHAGHWRPAAEIIDWSLQSESIFSRKRPLKEKTLARIKAGLKKFGGERFLILMKHSGRQPERSMEQPLPTITTARGGSFGLCEPFILQTSHSKTTGRGKYVRGVDQPLTTITGSTEHALVQPFLVEYHGPKRDGDERVRSVNDPLPTATTENRFGLCQPFVVQVAHGGGEERRVRGIDEPLMTIPAGHRGELGLVQPFVTKYYSTGGARPVDIPLDTVTAKARFALVEPMNMDIRFRMLQPHELAQAMGFDGYEFAGTKTDQVRQIGNAVAVRTAKALCMEILR